MQWHKASKSTWNGNQCVEVIGGERGEVYVRDSKDKGDGPVLEFTAAEWDAFLDGAKKGEFDDLASAPAGKPEAIRLLEYALHLRMYGERAPGGNETWREFETRTEEFLRALQPPR